MSLPAPAPVSGAAAIGPMARRARGLLARALYIGHRLLQRATGGRAGLQAYLLCAQPIGAGAYEALRTDAQSVVRRVVEGDPLLAALPRPPEALARRFAAGTECHAITVKGEFAGCIWLARGAYDEDEVRCRYELADPRRSVWDFDVYVVPRFRAGRTLGRLWKAVDAALQAEGVAWTCSRISLYNLASVQAHERLGARYLGLGCFLVLGRCQLAVLSRAPYLAFSVSDPAAPRVRLELPPA